MIYRYVLTLTLFFTFAHNSWSNKVNPEIYIFLGGNSPCQFSSYLDNPNIKGAQVIYSWRKLEPQEGNYDFSPILQDLYCLQKNNKKLFVQIQDRSFSPDNIPVPDYLITEPKYNGGVSQQIDNPGEGKEKVTGWVAKQWVPAVRNKFQQLLLNLGKKIDGKVTGVNLPETSVDIIQSDKPKDFCKNYFQAILENMTSLKSSFRQSYTVQYVNFIPCEWNNDKGFMKALFDYAIEKGIGLGNPDTVPYKKAQMRNSYPYFHLKHPELPIVATAVQEPDYTYTNPKTGQKFTIPELYFFNKNYLGAKIIFWNIQEPQFSQKLLPFIEVKNQNRKF